MRMKTRGDIEKQIKGIEWFIRKHKEQMNFYSESGDLDKIIEYAQKIQKLKIELDLLGWVLNEPN